jgi:hypothetical protein
MPGHDEEERTLATLIALACFSAAGHSGNRGAFRTHVRRLISFLETRAGDPLVHDVLARIKKGRSLTGDWTDVTEPLRHGRPLDPILARLLLTEALA